ncbi:MAG: hypothetical protein HYY30_02940 [Chloroflexi bacterium]|nr:hypothetical protein [Chloroflexota bacterium]
MVKVIVATRNTTATPEFAGSTWVPLQYVFGLRKLGVEAYWVERLRHPIDPIIHPHSIHYLMDRFHSTAEDFAFQDNYCVEYNRGERYFGMTEKQLEQLINEADLMLNISGYLPPNSPLMRIPRRAFVDVDPGYTQIWVLQTDVGIDRHNFFFTVGQNVGRPEFSIPTQGVKWQTILPFVVLDLWPACIEERYHRFSTIGDWRAQNALFEGEYYGTKREQFVRFLRVPVEAKQKMEPALCIGSEDHEDMGLLFAHDWLVRDPYLFAGDPHSYREFIQHSRAEFSVAKSGYIKSNSGWFSDRTACYLASGKPALVQSTGFEWRLPTGKGLLTYSTIEEAVACIQAINNDYIAHCYAARALAEQYFDSDIVLSSILKHVGL